MSPESPAASQEAVFRFLADPRTHGLSEPVRRIDTAGAVVFLAGPDVYKVKRAVVFPFMDLSTLEKRRRACEAEIAVNRASAPGVYLAALPIARSGETLAIGGRGEAVEWVTHMRRFDENATLDRVAARSGVTDDMIDKLAIAIRRSHARAPLSDARRSVDALETYIEQNGAFFAERPDLFDAASRPEAHGRCAAGVGDRAAGPAQARRGRICPPLSRRSASAQHRPHRRGADAVRRGRILGCDRQRRRPLRPRLPADGSRGARPARLGQPALQPLPRARAAGGVERPRRAAAVPEPAGGDPGQGRSGRGRAARGRKAQRGAGALAGAISIGRSNFFATLRRGWSRSAGCRAPEKARSPARSLRGSAGRLARFGCAATSSARRCSQSRRPSACKPRPTRPRLPRDVYRRLIDKARVALRAGQAVALDATFAAAEERAVAAGAAAEVGVAFAGLFLDAPLATRLERIASRRADASDADAEVARRQTAEPLAERGWAALDASGNLTETTSLALARLANA